MVVSESREWPMFDGYTGVEDEKIDAVLAPSSNFAECAPRSRKVDGLDTGRVGGARIRPMSVREIAVDVILLIMHIILY